MQTKRPGFSPLWLALIVGLVGIVTLIVFTSGKLKNQETTDVNLPAGMTEVSNSDDVDTIEAELNSSDVEGMDKELSPALQEAGY